MNSYTRPDALLEEANREKRGKLKIFLGAAPGLVKPMKCCKMPRAKKSKGSMLLSV